MKNTLTAANTKGPIFVPRKMPRLLRQCFARWGTKIIEYESNRYKVQKLVAFSNWPTTDPFRVSRSGDGALFEVRLCGMSSPYYVYRLPSYPAVFASYHVYPCLPTTSTIIWQRETNRLRRWICPKWQQPCGGSRWNSCSPAMTRRMFYDSDGNLDALLRLPETAQRLP